MRIRWRVVTLVALAGLAAAPVASADDSVTPMCNGQACTGAWYTSPVAVTWVVSQSPAPDSTTGCAGVEPSSHDLVATTACEAIWTASSDDIKRTYTVHVELSSPTITATADRSPDPNGWYNHPVSVSFSGSAFSGIQACSPTNTYGGPAGANVTINGSCTDNAGKVATTSLSLKYDDTPPTVTGATPSRAPDSGGYYTRPVTFHFNGVDGVSGIASCDTVTYSGPSSGTVTGGCHDQAGNYTTISVPVKYRAATPVASVARAGSSLRLHWKAAAHANYYNVQIYRAGKKVLSIWPSKTTLLLRRSWSFAGHKYKLKPGRYRWYVWPGYGSRRGARYGHMIASSTFKVTKPA